MINLHERMLPNSAGVEPATSWLFPCLEIILPDNMASLIFPDSSNYQLLIPVHVLGGKPMAAIGQLSTEIWSLKKTKIKINIFHRIQADKDSQVFK